jgi:YesN/AraC family two-component response regulator
MDYLLKPVDDQRLGRTIARLRSSLAAPPAVPPEALLARLRDLLAGSHGYAHLFRQM